MEYALPTLTEHTCGPKDRFWITDGCCVDCWKLIIVEDGSFTFELSDISVIAEKYSAVLFPVKTDFHRQVINELKIHNLSLVFDKDDQWLKRHGQYLYGKLDVSAEMVRDLCSLLNKCKGDETLPLKDAAIKSLWSYALVTSKEKLLVQGNGIIMNKTVLNATNWIRANSNQKIYVQDIAKKFGYTHLKFTRLFTKEMGMTPIEYINTVRLEKAKRLLSESNLNINAVAIECGFDNQFYFHNRFKKKYGVSPSEYRKSSNIHSAKNVF